MRLVVFDHQMVRSAWRRIEQHILLGLAVVTSCTAAGANIAFAGPFVIEGGGTYDSLAAAVAAAASGSVIDVVAGTYRDQSATIPRASVLTIQSVGGMAIFDAVSPLANTQGIIKTFGDLTVNGLEFTNAAISNALGGNGAGIRYKRGNLTVLNSVFRNNQEGILGDADPDGTVLIDHSTFIGNGNPTDPQGLEHAIYVTRINSLTVQNSTITGTTGAGSNIQSRAAHTSVLDNVMDDGTVSQANYAINVPNGGEVLIAGNAIEKGSRTTNHRIVAYGAAGAGRLYSNNSLTVAGNTFTSTDPHAIGVEIFSPDGLTATMTSNSYNGSFRHEIVGLSEGDAPGTSPVGGAPDPVTAVGTPVSEPGSLSLFLGALIGLIGLRAFGCAIRLRLGTV
ncbi:MAG TPA: hypothetical protein VN750_03665 [Steroidobacteraceae bacterium]|nr:hypothetical protein [Steroidobacteraceae bacterium]